MGSLHEKRDRYGVGSWSIRGPDTKHESVSRPTNIEERDVHALLRMEEWTQDAAILSEIETSILCNSGDYRQRLSRVFRMIIKCFQIIKNGAQITILYDCDSLATGTFARYCNWDRKQACKLHHSQKVPERW
ncbi:hypothetical protein NY2A_b838R [Paramecium bursaria Chlorella virus NY2A]|uniref:Uncharacterized protein b838R n=1 Tax=Paramecium bursaria Chlorella virus NY2A TaxID=46021 RepID=A7IY13_PBCVN|nr:hypothetical protein NY2A_b838R [Paramecium bursaria Chlorella virus NY2A]ABT15237.1 hypothetical protein NY2A_b838R [Paramecium bursaria Chlorella virus NY2A]